MTILVVFGSRSWRIRSCIDMGVRFHSRVSFARERAGGSDPGILTWVSDAGPRRKIGSGHSPVICPGERSDVDRHAGPLISHE